MDVIGGRIWSCAVTSVRQKVDTQLQLHTDPCVFTFFLPNGTAWSRQGQISNQPCQYVMLTCFFFWSSQQVLLMVTSPRHFLCCW